MSAAMALYAIDSAGRQAAFVAQVGHESGRLVYVRELWGPTPAQQRYEGRADLGNTQPGDGFKYRGRGLIQVTGRANYLRAANALALPLVEQPELLEQPGNACLSAAWFWNVNGLNELADVGDFNTITKRINGGFNGLQDRLDLWNSAKAAIGVTA
ncbi:glycoside hydrolase family 19 protein [Burkholderia stagnalis]|uniref:glycoside hydrolase family 19 protein n=1 Tax=Burkholderia stagnalis TaxID=1503054 RepID=UPI002AB4F1F1|nr:glycoside hydrolase family 19 protein [Burkholderia stagnalis]MDY7802825.1 glycoside hydrolase family 19 protein [Burkholderia stagnalis]